MCSQDTYVRALYERLLGANVHWQCGQSGVFRDGAMQPAPIEGDAEARFGYPLRGGLQALIDGFLPLLPGKLRLGTAVIAIDGAARRVELSTGESIGYQNLIATAPLPQVVRMLGSAVPAGIRDAARALRSTSVRCVHVGVKRAAVTDKHWMEFPEGTTIFNRIIAQTTASAACSPPGAFGLTCEIPYSTDRPLAVPGKELIERVLDDCRRVGLLRDDDEIELAFETDVPLAHVVDDEHRARHVERIRNWLTTLDIHLAGPYAEWDTSSEPVMHSWRAVARRNA
jgi:protoporphyrinogen oxidase